MGSNVSREKLLFYAAAGGLGGFGAWGTAEPFLGIHSVYGRDLLLGALVVLFIAAFLVARSRCAGWRRLLGQRTRPEICGGRVAEKKSV